MDLSNYQLFRKIASVAVAVHLAVKALRGEIWLCRSGSAIYQPGGKANEYAKYACSIYVGCPGGCDYCYREDPVLVNAIGGSRVRLKGCFDSESDAVSVYFKELFGGNGGRVRPELLKQGIFFTFTSDPGLPNTFPLFAALICETVKLGVPVQFLTKMTEWIDSEIWQDMLSIPEIKEHLSIGFTLTGRDDLEPGASPNSERIAALRRLHNEGFKTFASIEPVIDFERSYLSVLWCSDFVDLFRVGLESHRKYEKATVLKFVDDLAALPEKPYIYLKDSIIDLIGRERGSYGENFVEADFRP